MCIGYATAPASVLRWLVWENDADGKTGDDSNQLRETLQAGLPYHVCLFQRSSEIYTKFSGDLRRLGLRWWLGVSCSNFGVELLRRYLPEPLRKGSLSYPGALLCDVLGLSCCYSDGLLACGRGMALTLWYQMLSSA